MPADTAQIEALSTAAPPPKAGGKARLLTLDGLDRRTAAYAATRKLIDDIEGDLGGCDRLSTGERQLVQRAAVLGAVLTDTESRWVGGRAYRSYDLLHRRQRTAPRARNARPQAHVARRDARPAGLSRQQGARLMKRRTLTILDAVADEKLFAPWFRDAATWAAWRAFLAALFALPMTPDQLTVYSECTGRTEPPTTPATEAWLCIGRRGGKSFILALCAVFLACFHDYRKFLSPGERGSLLVIAVDRRQARVIFRYVRALLLNVPMLAKMIEREAAESFDLRNGVSIEISTASFKSVRGYAIVAALIDEIAFLPTDDSASPDYELLDALRPGTATIPNAIILGASSPYAKKGALYDTHRKHYAKNGDPVLVWKAPTRTINPTVPQSVIDAAIERDPSSARAEWMAEFRDDIADLISREAVMACVEPGVRERAPQIGKNYISFTDPSGGSSDSMTTCIGHMEGNLIVVDCVREIVAPFDPESATDEIVKLFRTYGIRKTNGDRYASAWCSQAFEKRKIEYRHSELPKSGLYQNLLPHLNGKTIRLLDIPRAVNQIASLERHTSRGGRDSVDHPPQGHDDIANAIAGLAYVALDRFAPAQPVFGFQVGAYTDDYARANGLPSQGYRI